MQEHDAIVLAAVRAAAEDLFYTPGKQPEDLLVAAVRGGFTLDRRVRGLPGEPPSGLENWTRPPGGLDLAVDLSDGSGRLVMEMKIAKPDESLWDAIKLADIQALDSDVRAGYLVSDASWAPGAQGAALLADDSTWAPSCRGLIARWPEAWTYALIGGRGIRPRTSVGGVRFEWIGSAPLARYGGPRLVVVVRVSPDLSAEPQTYDGDGFPVGYTPPVELRERVQRAVARLRSPAGGSSEASLDPCHGYEWHRRWTPRRLSELVPGMSESAYQCLRKRLADERDWKEAELRDRVDVLRS